MSKACYHPWFPLNAALKPYPLVHCQLNHLSLTINWQQEQDSVAMIIYFPTIAGLQVIDESSYQTYLTNVCDGNNSITFPLDEDLHITENNNEYFCLPWPIWKSVKNTRLHCYGGLGEHIYTQLYSYYIISQECVYLIDTECEPEITSLII